MTTPERMTGPLRRRGTPLLAGLGLLVLAAIGYAAYLHAGAWLASAHTLSPAFLLVLALIGGAASFFSPCSIAITPAFLAYLSSGNLTDAGTPPRRAASLRAAVQVALGIVAFYAVAAALIGWIGNIAYNGLIYLLPVVGAGFVLLGMLMLSGRTGALASVARWNPMNRLYERGESTPGKRKAGAMLGFGFAYGAASHTCSLPIFLGILMVPLIAGNYAVAALAVLVYGAAIALLVVVMMALGQRVFAAWRRVGPWLTRLTALLFIATGGFLFYYFAHSSGAFSAPVATLSGGTAPTPSAAIHLVEGNGPYPYEPRTLAIPAGRPVRVAVTDHVGGCLLRTVFEGLGPSGGDVDVVVPVGTTRIVTLRAAHPGRYRFHCGANMYAGTVVATP